MYSPGKAFVVYEMRRHVCVVSTHENKTAKAAPHFANGTVTRDNALFTVSPLQRTLLHVSRRVAHLERLSSWGSHGRCGMRDVCLESSEDPWALFGEIVGAASGSKVANAEL